MVKWLTRDRRASLQTEWVDRVVFSRNRCFPSCRMLGEQMASIHMIPIGPIPTLNRSILLTERGMSGTGGDDYNSTYRTSPMKVFCGRQMIDSTIFDPYRVDLRLGCKLLSIWSAKPRAYHS